jgi:protease I
VKEILFMEARGLEDKTVAILVADNFHVLETYYPYYRLKEEGATVLFIGAQADTLYRDSGGEPVTADLSVEEALLQKFDLIHCPGGFAPLTLRADPVMLELAQTHFERGGLFATICHGGSFLVSMGILKGMRATCYKTLKDDLVNAGAEYVDDAPIIDGNLITGRTPADLPVYMEAIVAAMRGDQPPEADLAGKKAAVLVERRYQVHEVWCSYFRLKAKHVDTVVIGPDDEETVFSRCSNYPLRPDLAISAAASDLYDAVLVTGDWASDRMRVEPPFVDFLRTHHRAGRIVASIAEGHSVLVSAGLLPGTKVAALPEMRPDVENAGAEWVGSVTAIDGNLVTGGGTSTLPRFLPNLISAIAEM